MNNMFSNIQYIMSEYNNFKNNPIQWLTSHNISNPQQVLQNPQSAVQNMTNSGMMNSQQINQIMSMAQMMRGFIK